MTQQDVKYKDRLISLLDSELDDYGMTYDISEDEISEEYEYYSVKVKTITDNPMWEVRIRLSKKTIEVDLYEDSWEEVEDFEWTIKYFWMALLMK